MAGALAATAGAGALPPPAAPHSAPAQSADPGDSFLAALGLNQQPAAKPDAKAPPAGSAERKDGADAAADARPAAAPDNPLLAWLVNLIGGGEPAQAKAAAPADAAATQASESTDKTTAKAPALPNAASVVASPVAATAAAPSDPAALAASAGATAAALPQSGTATAHERTAAPAAPVAADAPAPNVAPAAPTAPPPVLVSNLQHNFASLLAQTQDSLPTASGMPHTALPQDSAVWPAALNEHVRWQLGEGVHEATLELHPRDLGSVQVQLRISPGGAEVQFTAAHPQARQALEQSLPQLRALLAADGLHLAQANVGSQSQSQPQAQSGRGRFSLSGEDAASGEPAASQPLRITRVGLVDDFA